MYANRQRTSESAGKNPDPTPFLSSLRLHRQQSLSSTPSLFSLLRTPHNDQNKRPKCPDRTTPTTSTWSDGVRLLSDIRPEAVPDVSATCPARLRGLPPPLPFRSVSPGKTSSSRNSLKPQRRFIPNHFPSATNRNEPQRAAIQTQPSAIKRNEPQSKRNVHHVSRGTATNRKKRLNPSPHPLLLCPST
jgi:hypothetical protein